MTASFHPEALTEYREAVLYYGEKGGDLGEAFVREVETAIEAIRASPRLQAADTQGARRRLVRRFPYAIRYRVEMASVIGRELTVMIYAIRHLRREQLGWRRRLPASP